MAQGNERGREKGLSGNRERPSQRLHLLRIDMIAFKSVGFVELWKLIGKLYLAL